MELTLSLFLFFLHPAGKENFLSLAEVNIFHSTIMDSSLMMDETLIVLYIIRSKDTWGKDIYRGYGQPDTFMSRDNIP